MNNFFKGPFKDILYSYYQYKINLGYDFESEKSKLKDFDNYTINVDEPILSQELIYDFVNSKDVNSNTKASNISVLRGFIKYLYQNEKCNFLIPTRIYRRTNPKPPHIFTEEEIKVFFKITKDFYPEDELKNLLVYLCFKLLYCTGMRISECLNIKLQDIDFDNNSITLYNTKNNVDRRIIVNDNITKDLSTIKDKFIDIINLNNNNYIFTRRNGKKYMSDDMYSIFRKILYYAGIEHNENGPTIHCFRHTFCVRSYQKILESGTDYNTNIAALSAYVGHKNFLSTEYYLRLVSELYPQIRNKVEEYSSHVITRLDDYDE